MKQNISLVYNVINVRVIIKIGTTESIIMVAYNLAQRTIEARCHIKLNEGNIQRTPTFAKVLWRFTKQLTLYRVQNMKIWHMHAWIDWRNYGSFTISPPQHVRGSMVQWLEHLPCKHMTWARVRYATWSRSIRLAYMERPHQKECTYEIWTPFL